MNVMRKSGDRIVAPRNVKRGLARGRRARRGSVSVLMCCATPPLLLIAGLVIDTAYRNYQYQLLRGTSAAAAIAAQATLYQYYANGTATTLNTAAQAVATANMPASTYGTVVPTANITLGTWDSTTNTFTATTTSPTAVQVKASYTENPLFGKLVGLTSIPMTATATASYAPGMGTAMGFNTIILNDLSMSFSSEIANQRVVDAAILKCVQTGTGGTGQVGISSIGGGSTTLEPLQTSSATNMTSMTTYINGTLNYCGKSSMPACSGSNVSAGLYNAVAQLMTAGIAGPQSNIVIITDGVPNADDISYTASMGTETPPLIAGTTYSTAVRNAQVTTPVCASTKGVCTDANLLTATHNQVAFANALGINISTIYYTGDTASGSVASYETELASWVTGKGTAIIAPTAASINTNFAQFCSSMGSAAKSVSVIH